MNRQYNLLMVEDNPADVRLMIEAIREAELTDMVVARYAYDGDEAMNILKTSQIIGESFDMILLDLNMPKVNGKELLAKIKDDEDFSSIKVFIMTNSDYKHDMLDCYKLKADAYIQKPSDFRRLIDFFVCVKRSIEMNNRLSVFQIERSYEEMLMVA